MSGKWGDNGGPAFPSEQGHTPDGTWNQTYESGMSLRDWFAGQALAQIIQNVTSEHDDWPYETAARCAYEQADAMLAARGVP